MMLRHTLVFSFAAITLLNAQAPTLSTMDAYKKAIQSNQPTIIMFTGSHCGPCKIMKPHFDNIAGSRSDVQCYIIDAACQELKPILKHLDIMSIPTLICCQDGKVFHREKGGLTGKGIGRVIQDFHKKRKANTHLQMALPAALIKPAKPVMATKRSSPAKKTINRISTTASAQKPALTASNKADSKKNS